MDSTTDLLQRIMGHVEARLREELEREEPRSVSEMEERLQGLMRDIACFSVGRWLEEMDGKYVLPEVPCPCGQKAQYVRRREGVIVTLFDRVRFRRAYYLCPHCHRGHYPLDERMGYQPGCLTPGLTSIAGQVGAALPFERASDLLNHLCGISLSENTIRRATQGIGEEVLSQEEDWLAESQDPAGLLEHARLPPARKPRRLYGSLDGVKVPMQNEWRELKIGCWYTEKDKVNAPFSMETGERARATQITYYADIAEAVDFGQLLWATGYQRLAEQASELVFVADGAAWIWNLVQEHFPEAIQIVDWYHAVEYIAPVASAVFGENTPESQVWREQVRSDLWEGRFQEVLTAFEEWFGHSKAGPLARKAWTYYTNNRERMRYPEYRAKGLRIGSGTVESGCKQIGTQRLKVAGARWGVDGARKVAKARAALLSAQWDTITARMGCLPRAA